MKNFKIIEKDKYSIVDLLPHDPPMVLLDHVIAYKEDFVHTVVTIRNSSPFFEEGGVPSYVALEYMAQTVGVWNGLLGHSQSKKPQTGFLLGTRQLTLNLPVFTEGSELNVFGQLKYNNDEIASFDCWIDIREKRAAQARLNVFQPRDIDNFLIP